jgi:SHS2 domain-containing protein
LARCDYAADTDKIERKASPVKAVTYHGLKVEESPDGWTASVIFDV